MGETPFNEQITNSSLFISMDVTLEQKSIDDQTSTEKSVEKKKDGGLVKKKEAQ